MRPHLHVISAIAPLAVALAFPPSAQAHGDTPASQGAHRMIEEMREMHRGHDHGHDFEAMEEMSHEDMEMIMTTLRNLGLVVPPLDAAHGKQLFMEKGCIVCHQVNGVGGDMGPSLDAKDMPPTMNAFEFAARMWRGASTMIPVQEELFGEQIELSGQDLADIIAFAHDETVQTTVKPSDVPERMRDFIP